MGCSAGGVRGDGPISHIHRELIRTAAGPLEGCAVCVQRWPVHRFAAGAAVPGGVPAAAMPEARDVADEDLVGAETVPVGAAPGGLVIHLPSTARTSCPSYMLEPYCTPTTVGTPPKQDDGPICPVSLGGVAP
jgi:hypothetical protein